MGGTVPDLVRFVAGLKSVEYGMHQCQEHHKEAHPYSASLSWTKFCIIQWLWLHSLFLSNQLSKDEGVS